MTVVGSDMVGSADPLAAAAVDALVLFVLLEHPVPASATAASATATDAGFMRRVMTRIDGPLGICSRPRAACCVLSASATCGLCHTDHRRHDDREFRATSIAEIGDSGLAR